MATSGLLNDRYRLEDEIGRGGMAVVHRGHDTLLDRAVAIKLLRRDGEGDAGWKRMLAEARSAARLNHPNIVAVYDVGEAAGADGSPVPYIVMEQVDGEPLNARPRTGLQEIVAVASQVVEALEHAHAHGVVHRDLKPENILLSPDGAIKLTDFGLAQSVASRLSQSGVVVGTVYYIAPEQALGRAVDGRADLYSLGVILYEQITGQLPFIAEAAMAVVSLHLHAPVVPPAAHRPDLPPAFERLILDLLSKRPEDRPARAADVGRALEGVLTSGPKVREAEHSLLERIVRGRLVGRQEELQEALTTWRRAVGGEGGVLLITGEPGIGKTRLVRELTAHVEVTGGTVVSGECFAEGGAPFAPFADAIRRALPASSDVPQPVMAELLTFAPDLALRFPELTATPTTDPAAQQQRAFEGFALFCEALAADRPVMLFLDDIHWADAGSLQLIHYLARRVRHRPILLVLTYREVELDENPPLGRLVQELNRERLADRVKLGRLSREQTGNLLQAMFAEEISPEFLEGIYRESEGNPFFIEEICRALVESGRLRFEDGRWDRPAVEDLEIPQSVRGAILSRVEKLSETAREAMLMAAILGREFEFDILRQATEIGEEALIGALESAEKAQLITEARRNGDVTFAFLHALIPASLAESVSVLRRKLLHRRAAQAIEASRPEAYEILAYHWIEAGEDERARMASLRAGDRAHGSLARAEAARHYRAALERWPAEDAAGRAEILAKLADSMQISSADGTIDTFAQARDLYRSLGDRVREGEIERRIGRAYYEAGSRRRAMEHYRQAMILLEQGPPTPELARAVSSISQMHMLASEYPEAIAAGERALELAVTTGAEDARIHALNNVGTSWIGIGQVERGQAMLEQSARGAIAAGLGHDACRAYMNIASSLFSLGLYLEAIPVYQRLVDFAGQYRYRGFAAAAMMEQSGALWRAGEWRRALALDQRVVREPLFGGLSRVWHIPLAAMIEVELGRPGPALEHLVENLPRVLEDIDEPQSVFPMFVELLRAAYQVGDGAAARQAERMLVERIDAAPTTYPDAGVGLLEAIRGRLAAGETASTGEVDGLLERLRRVVAQIGVLRLEACLEEAMGLMAAAKGDDESAVPHAAAAAQAWRRLPAPLPAARCLSAGGRALIALGRPDAARATLGEAAILLNTLAAQLDSPDDRASFEASELVTDVRRLLGATHR